MNTRWSIRLDAMLRVLFALTMMCVTFILVFLLIFVPLLLRDMHYAPYDGQGGMGGALLGIPIAGIAALVSAPLSYSWAVKRSWFEWRKEPRLESEG